MKLQLFALTTLLLAAALPSTAMTMRMSDAQIRRAADTIFNNLKDVATNDEAREILQENYNLMEHGYLDLEKTFLNHSGSARCLVSHHAELSHNGVVRALLDHGVDVDNHGGNGYGMNALYFAVRQGNTELTKTLIQYGANISKIRDWYYRGNALMEACRWSSERETLEVVKVLIEAGIDVNAADLYGKTALELTKDEEIIKCLTNAGAAPKPCVK